MTPEPNAYPDTNLLIDGVWRQGSGGRQLPVIDPATGDTIGHVAVAEEADIDAAADAAARGFAVWSAVSPFERSKLLRRAADLLRERREAIAQIMTREQGKPLAEAMSEIGAGADIIDWFAEECRRSYGQTIPPRAPGVLQMTIKLPLGPVAGFAPWNFPVNQVVRKVAVALAAGCSIVVKPSEETPASPAALIACFLDAGLPPGAIGLLYGEPAAISTRLIDHPAIAKISFTGSTAVGREIAAKTGQRLKRVTLELGGHAPAVVLADADIEKAVKVLSFSKLRNAGQVCVSPTRMLVETPVFDAFTEGFVQAAAAVTLGNGLDPASTMGPLANERRISAMDGLVGDAVAKGARLLAGGERMGNRGFFYRPTVLANVPLDARIMTEEPFGPVAIINPVSSLDAAIAEANRLPYGLASYAFTGSSVSAQRLGRELRAGMTTINHNGLALPEVPFGGIGDSGHGDEGGTLAMEAYLINKFVTLA